MATFYVSKVGGQVKYRQDAWPDASNGTVPSPADLNQLFFDLGNDAEIVLDAITFSGTDLDATDGIDIGRSGQTIREPQNTDPDFATHAGTPVLDGTGLNDHTLVLTGANTIGAIKITGADASKYNIVFSSSVGNELNKTILDGGDSAFLLSGSATATFNRVQILNTDLFAGDVNGAGASLTMNYCLRSNCSSAVRVLNGDFTENNCLSIGNGNESVIVVNNNAQNVTLNNSIHFGSNTNGAKHIVSNTSGNAICVANNCLIGRNPFGPTFQSTGFTLNNCVLDKGPSFRSLRRPHRISITVDDTTNRDTFATVVSLAEINGFKATWCVNTDEMTASDWTNAVDYVSRGHEIAAHSRGHCKLNATQSIDIQYVGAGSACTMTISGDVLTTSVTGGPGGENLNIDLTAHTFGSLATFINNIAAYTCSVTDVFNTGAQSRFIADVAGQDIRTSEYTAGIDTAAYISYEVAGSKTDIEANIPGYTCKSFMPPYFATNADVKQAIFDAGFIGARIDSNGSLLFSDIEAFALYGNQVGSLFGLAATVPSESQIKGTVAALVDYLGWFGGFVSIIEHELADSGTDYGATNLGHVFSALRQSRATVQTFGEAMQFVVDNAESTTGTGGTLHYTRSENDLGDNSNYRLRPSSPCINSGVNVSLMKDFFGVVVDAIPDIGISEFTTNNRKSSLSIGFRLKI